MFHQPFEYRLVHDAGIGTVGHVQEFVAGVHDRVNVRGYQPGCIPIVANASEGGRYLPTVTVRIDGRAAPAAPGQSRLHQGLQVGLNLQHLLDEGNQFRLAKLPQARVQVFHRAEGIGLVQPGRQKRSDVLADVHRPPGSNMASSIPLAL